MGKAYSSGMNVLFSIVFLVAAGLFLLQSPDGFLATVLDGASKSAVLCFSLIATYAVWLGLMNVWKDAGVSQAVSKLLKPLAKRIFKVDDTETLDNLSMNLSVNLLGISGAATPYGIKVAQFLDRSEYAEYSSAMFFVVNATSIQLIPTSIIGVRVALGSVAPADVVLPTLVCTVFSTLIAMALVRMLIPPKRAVFPSSCRDFGGKICKSRGAGI